ncbi:DUF4276 family protein [Dolichospermum circinale]|uniref:DUF4276 family protein n=1 Tax=Dolichospermum circinale TaxID=109265 RepID=UPI0004000664|nr:DUF4276 family protein [Dolichospermum circinale]
MYLITPVSAVLGFLILRLQKIPKLKFITHDGRIPKGDKLKRIVENLKDLAKSNKSSPAGLPEKVNHGNPPFYRIKEIFETGKCKRSYNKIRDAARILKGQDLMVSINQCAELKAFINTILELCKVDLIP